MVKFKEKRAESCHAQMSTFFGTLINKMQPSVDKMFVTPQRQAKKSRMSEEKSFIFLNFPLVSRKRLLRPPCRRTVTVPLGMAFTKDLEVNQKMVLANPHFLQSLVLTLSGAKNPSLSRNSLEF